jgi:uncharacterized protein YegL
MKPAMIRLTAVAVTTTASFVAVGHVPAAAGAGSDRRVSNVPVEVVLVLDASSSVRYGPDAADREAQVRDVTIAARSVLHEIGEAPGVDARVAVVSYDKDVRTHVPLSAVTADTMGGDGPFGQALGDPGDNVSTLSASTGYAEHLRGGIGSNWEAALAETHQLLGAARSNAAQVVVHVTDGEPTAHLNSDGEPTLSGEPGEHLAAAAQAATQLENANVRLLTVGIGNARSRLASLVAVSGPDIYDQKRSSDIFDPAAHDVILLEDPETLGSLLSDVLASTAAKPGPDAPPATAETWVGADDMAVTRWPWVLGAAALILMTMLAFATLEGRRRNQMLGAGGVGRKRRATKG